MKEKLEREMPHVFPVGDFSDNPCGALGTGDLLGYYATTGPLGGMETQRPFLMIPWYKSDLGSPRMLMSLMKQRLGNLIPRSWTTNSRWQ